MLSQNRMLGPFLSLDNQEGSVCADSAEHAPRHSESFPGQPCATWGEGAHRGVGLMLAGRTIVVTGAARGVGRAEDARAAPGPQSPEDIVDTVVFLLTPGALALTGQVLAVNAGFVFT
jgi:hypothetical protein